LGGLCCRIDVALGWLCATLFLIERPGVFAPPTGSWGFVKQSV
jgi:hypothetical protein